MSMPTLRAFADTLRLSPHLVICSRTTTVVEANALVWIELYPGHTSCAVVELMGQRETIPEMDFEKLLSTIERAKRFCVPA